MHQRNCLHSLWNDPNLMVIWTDKNLGPALIERKRYINLAFKDHLGNHNVYQQLTKHYMEHAMVQTY